MSDDERPNIIPVRMTHNIARDRVRAISMETKNIYFTDHALERMEERDITDFEVYDILRTGQIETIEDLDGADFKSKITKKLPGRREAGVVTAIKSNEGKLIIITVEWEDL